jgi:hypothetical protein
MQEYPEYPLDVPGKECLEIRLLNERGSAVQLLRYRVFRSDAEVEDDDGQYWQTVIAKQSDGDSEQPLVGEDGKGPFRLEFQIAEESYDDTEFGVMLQVEFQEVGDTEKLISEHLLFVIQEESASYTESACADMGLDDEPADPSDPEVEPSDGPRDSDGDNWNDWLERECGTDPNDENDRPQDDDDDGYCDAMQYDDDGDGWPDWFEQQCSSDPYDYDDRPEDLDDDGICDWMDVDQESDSDGYSDWIESECGSSPYNSSDSPSDYDTDGDDTCDAMD